MKHELCWWGCYLSACVSGVLFQAPASSPWYWLGVALVFACRMFYEYGNEQGATT